jgi:hypothetical protein
MSSNKRWGIARTRALITERERDAIAGNETDKERYEAVSRVRARVHDELVRDMSILCEHHEDLYAEVREVVSDE